MAARSRQSPPRAASGNSQIAYHGRSHAVEIRSASIAQPAATLQSAPRAVRHSAITSTTEKAPRYACLHQSGVPESPTSRAVSAGTLWLATKCCCSPTASRNPSVCEPKASSPSAARASSASAPLRATAERSRQRGAPSTTNGSTIPAAIFTPMPATTATALPRSPPA